jgi:hypothetical protein
VNKEIIINEFFRAFRVTLTNAFSYPKTHPYFVKSAESFKLKLQAAQSVLDPFIIVVTDSELLLGQDRFNLAGVGSELARLLHQRKIKSITIKSGLTLPEIIGFFSIVSMSPKDILKAGGINLLLEKQLLSGFLVEELDYSAFLQEQGQENTEIWGCLLKDMLESDNPDKINTLVDDFSGLIKRVNQNDIFQNEEIPEQIAKFLFSLREKNKDLFAKCSQELFLWLLRNKKSLDEDKLGRLKLIFDRLNQEELGALFLEGVAKEDNFDVLSLEIFSKIAEQKNSDQITDGFLAKLQEAGKTNLSPKVAKRVRNLLIGMQGERLSAVYRNTLEALVKSISSFGALTFDQKELKENYRYIVLNILAIEDNQENLRLAAQILEKEFANILGDNNLELLKDISSLLLKKKKEGNVICADLEKKFSVLIENFILSQPLNSDQEPLVGLISSAGQDMNFYLNKIFDSERADKYILSLFLKFFPGNLDIFYLRVEEKVQDIEFICSLIEALSQLSSPVTIGILDNIYSSVNELIKIEILNNLRKLKKVDVQFLLRQLDTPSPSLRKNLLSVLILDGQMVQGALELLLKNPNFAGSNNERLIENMQIVSDLGLIEAAGLIRDLSRRRFFWNRKLRSRARQILKEWNVN